MTRGVKKYKIMVIGSNYVGLTYAACLASFGLEVVYLDEGEKCRQAIKNNALHLPEAGLLDIICASLNARCLSLIGDFADVPANIDAFIIASDSIGSIYGMNDMSQIYKAFLSIVKLQSSVQSRYIVLACAVPVGTADNLSDALPEESNFEIISHPCFIREGCAVEDFLNPEHIIIGCKSDKGKKFMSAIFKKILGKNIFTFFTGHSTAELFKYAHNLYVATRITLANEISDICHQSGANLDELLSIMAADSRIGKPYLRPSPGFSGHNFYGELSSLSAYCKKIGCQANILESVLMANEKRRERICLEVLEMLPSGQDKLVVAIIGLAFKSYTNDVRRGISLQIAEFLAAKNINIHIFDPIASDVFLLHLSPAAKQRVILCSDCYDVCSGADLVIFATDWPQFRAINFVKLHLIVRTAKICDLRRAVSKERVEAAGFEYLQIGQKSILKTMD